MYMSIYLNSKVGSLRQYSCSKGPLWLVDLHLQVRAISDTAGVLHHQGTAPHRLCQGRMRTSCQATLQFKGIA